MTEQRIHTQSRLDWVDGLKGISAIIVVLQHTFVTIFGLSVFTDFRLPIVHNLWDGNFAVSVFIILSTILTCHSIEKHRICLRSDISISSLRDIFDLSCRLVLSSLLCIY